MNAESRKVVTYWFIVAIVGLYTAFFVFKSYDVFDEVVRVVSRDSADGEGDVTRWYLENNNHQLESGDFNIALRAALELDTIRVRHERASSSLLTRTWLRFMSSSFGAILITIGALFVFGKIKAGDTNAEAEAVWKQLSISIAVSSPGLTLVILGVFLMVVPNVTKQDITVDDTGSFFGASISQNSASASRSDSNEIVRSQMMVQCNKNPEMTGCERWLEEKDE